MHSKKTSLATQVLRLTTERNDTQCACSKPLVGNMSPATANPIKPPRMVVSISKGTGSQATAKCKPSTGGDGAATAAAGEGSEISRSSRSPMREEDGGCAAAAAEEGAPSETGPLLLLPPAAAAASSVVVRSRSAPLSSDGAGECAARVTNACSLNTPNFYLTLQKPAKRPDVCNGAGKCTAPVTNACCLSSPNI